MADSIALPSLADVIAAGQEARPEAVSLLDAIFGDTSTSAFAPGRAIGWHEDFLFVLDADVAEPPEISVDDGPRQLTRAIPGSRYWVYHARLDLGVTHNYRFFIDGRAQGVSPASVAGYLPLSYRLPEAAVGELSGPHQLVSDVYGGARFDYWTYANVGVNPDVPAPVMVWLDGHFHVGIADALGARVHTVTDNLVHLGQLPPLVHVLVNPGTGGARHRPGPDARFAAAAMRSMQYDDVTVELGQHLLSELLPEVARTYALRDDGYSRAIAGMSSGGAGAFKVGWFAPDQFARVHSTIGSFTALGWHPARGIEGAHMFPFWIRREPRRNLRVWLSDGAWDIDVANDGSPYGADRAGSWPLANLQMAQALKVAGYDFHFRFGTASHNMAQLALDLPESLPWLWRDYDPAQREQQFVQDPDEAAQPLYRVGVVNRDVW